MSTTVNFIDPRGKTYAYWTALMAEQFAALGVVLGVPTGTDDKAWRPWARTLVGLPQLANLGLPSPAQFKKWQDWAFQLLNYSVVF